MDTLSHEMTVAAFAEIVRLKDIILSKDEKISVLEEENKSLNCQLANVHGQFEYVQEKLEEGERQLAEDKKQLEETQNELNECKEDLKNKKGFIAIKFIIKLIDYFRGN